MKIFIQIRLLHFVLAQSEADLNKLFPTVAFYYSLSDYIPNLRADAKGSISVGLIQKSFRMHTMHGESAICKSLSLKN